MKKIFIIKYSLFILIALCTFSCRPQSDELLSLGQNDDQAFADANDSYAAEFKTLCADLFRLLDDLVESQGLVGGSH